MNDDGRWTEWITWIEEDGAQLRRDGRAVLDHRQMCRTGGAVVVVHRNIEGSALQVGVRGIDSKTLTATPRDLQMFRKAGEGMI